MRNTTMFLLFMMISGCGFVFQNFDQGEYQALRYGMSKDEVIAKIGKPQKISMMEIDDIEYEVWEYPDNNRSKTSDMNTLGVIYSNVFFLDGKLVQRDKDRVYAQPEYTFQETINPGSGVKDAQDKL